MSTNTFFDTVKRFARVKDYGVCVRDVNGWKCHMNFNSFSEADKFYYENYANNSGPSKLVSTINLPGFIQKYVLMPRLVGQININ